LVPEAGERGPLNILVRLPAETQRMSSLGIRTGDRVVRNNSSLELGDRHRVSLGSARTYSPRRKFALPNLEKLEILANLEAVTNRALLRGNKAGLGELLTLAAPGAATLEVEGLNMFASAALPRILRLEEAFLSGEKTMMAAAVGELVGLGPGLTPSSDDLLAGLVLMCALYARNFGRARRAILVVTRAVAEQPPGRTTILSEEFLRQAASGRGNERVMGLCTSMLTGGRESVERETERVLAIGETSGTDTVLGVVLGTMLCAGTRFGSEERGPG